MVAGRNVNTKSIHWNTPLKIATVVEKFLGDSTGLIDLDPCSNETSIIKAKVKYYEIHDGLSQDWESAKTIFINPPYGKGIKEWFKRGYSSSCNNGSEVVMLVPVATNTSHWKEYVFGKATEVGFIKDSRLKFGIEGNEDNKGAPMACCLLYYGRDPEGFRRACNHLCNFLYDHKVGG